MRIQATGRKAEALIDQAFAEMKRLEGMFNWKDPRSAINNVHPYDNPPKIKEIIGLSNKIKKLSDGAFDINFAGQMNLGGIGKGYAVEAARQLLVQKGIKNGIIDMRSTVAVVGKGRGVGWKIGIRDPREEGKILGVVKLSNGESLSTSGDYERGQHIIDPRDGKPAILCQSVTVIGTDAGETDALSTAVFVLGPGQGLKLIEKLGLKVVIVDINGKVYDNFGFKLR
ncbi:MAG: FAD:protein FMN transferase [bacterium]